MAGRLPRYLKPHRKPMPFYDVLPSTHGWCIKKLGGRCLKADISYTEALHRAHQYAKSNKGVVRVFKNSELVVYESYS